MQIRRKLTGALLALLALCAGQSFDPQHRVVISNPKIRALLGPMIASGHNPWSWYDNRATRSATLQFSLMDKNYPNVWDKPARGSISVKQGSATITGHDTQFQTDFCGGAGRTAVVDHSRMIFVWYNSEEYPGSTGRARMDVTGCPSQTSLTVSYGWNRTPGTQDNLSYSIADEAVINPWLYSPIPGGYYDAVLGYYSQYYRTGDRTFLIAARVWAKRLWRGPLFDRGKNFDFDHLGGCCITAGPARGVPVTGLILWALDTGEDIWPGMHYIWNYWKTVGWQYGKTNSWKVQLGDAREQGYITAGYALCSMYDADATWKSNCRTWLKDYINNFWGPLELPQPSSPLAPWQNTQISGPAISAQDGNQYVIATKGSPVVKIVGRKLNEGDFSASGGSCTVDTSDKNITSVGNCISAMYNGAVYLQIGSDFYQLASITDSQHATLTTSAGKQHGVKAWLLDRSLWFVNNYRSTEFPGKVNADAGDSESYRAASYTPDTITLDRPYNGTTGKHGLVINHIVGFGAQPFMLGMVGGVFSTYVYDALMANGDKAEAAKAKQFATDIVAWLNSTGIDQKDHSAYGARIFLNCEPNPLLDPYCSHSAVLNGELMRAYSGLYTIAPTPELKKAGDELYTRMWCKNLGKWSCGTPGFGGYLEDIDEPTGYMMTESFVGGKWFGYYFGYGFGAAWPAVREGASAQNGH